MTKTTTHFIVWKVTVNSWNGYGIESLKLLNLFIQFYLKTQKSKNPKALFCSCNYNAKKSSRRIRLYVDRYRPLESSIYLLISFSLLWFVICMECGFILVFFIFDRNSLVKTLWINWNFRFIPEPRWFNKTFKLSPKILWVRTIGSSLIQWIE